MCGGWEEGRKINRNIQTDRMYVQGKVKKISEEQREREM